jgi:hypothetical protein
VHVEVFTTRLVAQEFFVDGADTVLKVLGTIRTILCRLPVRTRAPSNLREVCRSVMRDIMVTRGDQWCIAILGKGATVRQGACQLVHTHMGKSERGVLQFRKVKSGMSLWDEMQRMGIAVDDSIQPLPPDPVDDDSREYVMLPRVVDTLALFYRDGRLLPEHEGGVVRLPSQSLISNRYVCCSNRDLVSMRNDFSNLWYTSFDYHVAVHTASRLQSGSSRGSGSGGTTQVLGRGLE